MTTPRTRSNSRSQARRRSLAWRGFLEHLEHRAVPAVFSVTTALDNGDNSSPTPGSLRAAIVSLNTSPDPTNSIEFDIPSPGVQTIRPLSSFPPITRPVVLDGFTQSDTPTTLPQIELDGSASPPADGLTLAAGSDYSVIRGLVINQFQGDQSTSGSGIVISGGVGHLVQGNFIGTDRTGTSARGNTEAGILLSSGTTAAPTIGGIVPAARNLISGNGQYGIQAAGTGSGGGLIQGNYIGTDAAGTAALGNGVGISLLNSGLFTIGGTTPEARNLISGNLGDGVQLYSDSPSGNLVQGNSIGTDAAGTGALGNGGNGVLIGARAVQDFYIGTYNVIGGLEPGAGNLIAHNSGAGIRGLSTIYTRDTFLKNLIYANAHLGIDLAEPGVTPNHPWAPFTGYNHPGNYPVLTVAATSPDGTSTRFAGRLEGLGLNYFLIEFYANASADPSRHGQGRMYLGALEFRVPESSLLHFEGTLPTAIPDGWIVSATATNSVFLGGTSEFSGLNMAPTISAPSSLPATAGSASLLGPGLIQVADFDGSPVQKTTLSVPSGTLSVTPAGGVNASGNGTGTLILTGSLTDLNATLNSLLYTTGSPGSNPLTITQDDQADPALGGPLLATATISILVNPPIAIDPAIPPGTAGTPYSNPLTATGGSAPLTFILAPGSSLPPGLALSETGLLSGTPATPGSFTFIVTATDRVGSSSSQPITAVVAPPVEILPSTLPPSTVGIAFNDQFIATGGTAPVVFSVADSSPLPPGLSLGPDGLLVGVPAEAGAFTFTVVATDTLGSTASRPFTINVAQAVAIVPQTPPPATEGIPYLDQLTATGGTTPVSFTLAPGSALPPGLSLSPEGQISGTPGSTAALSVLSASTPYTFTVVATDALGSTASQSLTIFVAPPVAIPPQTPPAATAGSPYSAQLTATGGTAPLTFALAPGSALPAGLTLSDTGMLSGTPATAGTFAFTVVATDALGSASSLPLSLLVSPASTTTVASLQRFGYHLRPTALVLTFSADLDPSTAQNPANYRVVLLGPGQRARLAIPVASATYDPSSRSVTLRFARRLPLFARYRLTVNASAPGGVTNSSGQLIDGSGGGTPGTDYVRSFGPRLLAGPTPPSPAPVAPRRAGLLSRARGNA